MTIPTTIFSKTIVNAYGNKTLVSLVHRPAGFDGLSEKKEAWIVRRQQPSNPCFFGETYKTKDEALNAYNEWVSS